MLRRLCVIFYIAVLAAVSVPANSNLSIDKLWVEFGDGQPGRTDIVIRNDSEDRYFITVVASEILAPGTEQEERQTQPDPERLGLLVTPNRIVLEPGALRSIRLVSLNQNLDRDRIYRVLIAPQVGDVQADRREEGDQQVVVKILAAYDVLVVARPGNARSEIRVERDNGEIAVTNVGNTNTLISEAFVCPENVEPSTDGCTSFESRRIYSGATLRFPYSSPSDKFVIRTRSGPLSESVFQVF